MPTLLAAGFLAVVLIVVGESVAALAVVLMEGLAALAVLGSAALAGGWPVHLVGLGAERWGDRLVIGAGLGIGALSLTVLGLGSVGLLTQPVAIAVVACLALVGTARLVLDLRECGTVGPRRGLTPAALCGEPAAPGKPAIGGVHWLWLAVCPFLAIALLAACLPPGVLWKEEGYGYDVLEYHLAVPKTFYEQGYITFLPHNVYSNFPSNSEMLSLLMMTLRGDAIEAAFMAKLTNVALAALFVASAWLAGRRFSPAAGVAAGVLAGTVPWITYLAGIAYVEVGMLAMGMCALTAMLKAQAGGPQSSRWILAAGLLAGLGCGYKYTAAPLIALPLALLPLFARISWSGRVQGVLTFTAAASLTFAPWMIRNIANTGNPVFPLAYSVFGAKAGTWDDTLEARWQYAHGPAGAGQSDTPTALLAVQRTIGDYRMGIVLFVLAAVGALMNRDRQTLGLAAVLIWQVIFWLMATHLFARFAVVMVLPMIALAARAVEARPTGAFRGSLAPGRVVFALLLAGAGWNLYHLAARYYDHTRPLSSRQPVSAYGCIDWFVKGWWPGTRHLGAINALGDEARVMMVGDARSFYVQPRCEYAVVFNHHPLAAAVRRLQGDEVAVLDWLRRRRTTHVLVHWDEMHRLRRTYGFYPEIDADLFARLAAAGLTESASFRFGDERAPYATLYQVPQDE